jgi:threonine synthase
VESAIKLRCRECKKEFPPIKLNACKDCFAPLDVIYDYDSIDLDPSSFISQKRPNTIWRYRELLPIKDKKFIIDIGAGFTPLIKCDNLGKALGINNLYVKNDSVNPTYSFKDRPASVAVSKALEFGAKAIACPSTGNLAAALAAHAGKASLPCYVFTPADIEMNKIAQIIAYDARIISIRGTYDDANRLAILASDIYGIDFANITLRPYYVEGSKTMAFEICEQLGWRVPDSIIVPVASGALFCALKKGLEELKKIGLIDDDKVRMIGAQAEGCSPIAEAFKNNRDEIKPIEQPKTIAKSIAIGNPGDGIYVLKIAHETKGLVDSITDEEIIEGIKLLAKYEGIFTEPAGSVTIGLLKKLIESGEISRDEEVVCCVTGNGLKTVEDILRVAKKPIEIEPNLSSLEKILKEVV